MDTAQPAAVTEHPAYVYTALVTGYCYHERHNVCDSDTCDCMCHHLAR